MTKANRTASGQAMTDLVLDLFRVSNRLLLAGDRLVADLGLTSARWQILGTISAAERPQPVAWLARDMGANRQNVQRIVNDLVEDGLLELAPNPHHRRAHLVVLTKAGQQAFARAMSLQAPWINELSSGLSTSDISVTHRVVKSISERLPGGRDVSATLRGQPEEAQVEDGL